MRSVALKLLQMSSAKPGRAQGLRYLLPFALLLAIAAGCGGSSDIAVRTGRSLEVWVSSPDVVDEVNFIDGTGSPFQIRAKASNRQLAVVEVTIVNRTSIVTPLNIDSEAAQLGDRRSSRINALDPFQAGKRIDRIAEGDAVYSPFLWSDTELERDRQITGYMVFDVPKGLSLGTFWWREVDNITVDLNL